MKFGLIGLVVALLFGVYLLFFSGPGAITNVPADGTSIVAFGDSLVAGVGATPGNDFVSQVATTVGEPIVNLGTSGDTTRDALARIDEVLDQDPKVVIVLLGGNDFLQNIPEAETFANLETIIETIHESGSAVLLLGVRGGVLRDNFKEPFAALANTHNTAYVSDVLDGLITSPELMSDRIHPNDAGYAIIAGRVSPVLADMLTQE